MRYVTYVLKPHQGYFDRGEERLREHGVTFETIQDIDRLTDDTVIMRKGLRGGQRDVRGYLEEGGSSVIDFQLTRVDTSTILQLHYEPSNLTRELLDIHRRYAVLLDYPLEYTGPENRWLRVSEVGPEEELRGLIEETRSTIDVEIERLGSYEPTDRRAFADLTDRQREVLRLAVEAGYYEEPRRVTYEDIAAKLGCSPGTVGQHLRRIEARLMSTIVAGSGSERESAPATGSSR